MKTQDSTPKTIPQAIKKALLTPGGKFFLGVCAFFFLPLLCAVGWCQYSLNHAAPPTPYDYCHDCDKDHPPTFDDHDATPENTRTFSPADTK